MHGSTSLVNTNAGTGVEEQVLKIIEEGEGEEYLCLSCLDTDDGEKSKNRKKS